MENKNTFTPIAMRCNQEQFDKIEPKLKNLTINVWGDFYTQCYLTNYWEGRLNIGNCSKDHSRKNDCKVYETWNENIFLEACGIEVKEPKEKKYKITREQILEIHKNASCNSKYDIEQLFPEVFENKLVEFNKWVVTPDYPKWIVRYDKDNDIFYGLNINGEWFHAELDNRNPNQISNVREATEQEVTEALTKEAVKRGFKDGVYFKTPENGYSGICSDSFIYNSEYNILYCGSNAVFNKGQWAEIIPTLTIKEAEGKLKELGVNAKIV